MTAPDDKQAVRFVVVTPVRDEAMYVAKTIDSMASQTVTPTEWIVVDDGSTDGTAEILDSCASGASWITVIHRTNRGYRAAGGGVVEAFNAAFAQVAYKPWDYIVKLDGDLSFDPEYFEACFQLFAAEKTLGIGGGTVCRRANGALEVDSAGDPAFHVRGATKIYRRECWDDDCPADAGSGLGHRR